MSQKILLVDGHSIANRGFYGLPPLTNSQGVHTNAILGFFNILMHVIDTEKPQALGIAFDMHAPTFRHQQYAAYKGTRAPMPDELREQIPLLQDLLEKAGLTLLMQEGFEADDLLGTLGRQHAEAGDEVYILSGDRDLLQLVSEKITLLVPKTKKGGTETEIYHPQQVQEKYGVSPEGYLQMKGLMGDSSDNIPGVPSIGEKTASKIIAQYETIENAIAHADEITPKRAGQNLSQYQQQARESLWLSTIKTDVPDPGQVTALTDRVFHTQAFYEGLKQYELKMLLKRFLSTDPARQEPGGSESFSPVSDDSGQLQQTSLEDFTPESAAESGSEQLPEGWGGSGPALQAENEDFEGAVLVPCWEDDVMRGMAVCQNGQCSYQEDTEDHLLAAVKERLENEKLAKVFFNLKPFRKELMKRGLSIRGKVIDLEILAYLLNAVKGSYHPDEIILTYASQTVPAEEEILGTGVKRRHWSDLTFQERQSYFTAVAAGLSQCVKPMEEELESQNMGPLYRDIEAPLTEVLSSMELEGIRVDVEVLDQIGAFLDSQTRKLEENIYERAGEEFNINSPKQLGTILFEKMGLPAVKKTKSGYSTSAEVLEDLRGADPIITDILNYRMVTKLRSTYVEGLKPCIAPDGKIHCQFQQTVTATGRLSCTDPNLQNIPIREDLGRQLRKAFVPRSSDYFFMDSDYSQIELRLMAHMSGDENMIQAYNNGADIHRLTASEVLHIPYDDVTPEQRSSAKAVNFGIIYGISAFSLSKDIGVTTHEAQNYIDRYFTRFPGVKNYLDRSIAFAKENGYAVTLYGRRRRIEELKSKNFALRSFGERVARNMPIQGTAADIIKIAMNRVYYRMKKEGLKSRLLVQVHDELLVEVYRPEEQKVRQILTEEMQGAATLKVPLLTEIHTGENWYEAK